MILLSYMKPYIPTAEQKAEIDSLPLEERTSLLERIKRSNEDTEARNKRRKKFNNAFVGPELSPPAKLEEGISSPGTGEYNHLYHNCELCARVPPGEGLFCNTCGYVASGDD